MIDGLCSETEQPPLYVCLGVPRGCGGTAREPARGSEPVWHAKKSGVLRSEARKERRKGGKGLGRMLVLKVLSATLDYAVGLRGMLAS